jgi:hypothetical protein
VRNLEKGIASRHRVPAGHVLHLRRLLVGPNLEKDLLLLLPAALPQPRRGYSRLPRVMVHDWWEHVVPAMRADPARFVRNFRVPYPYL